MDIKEKPLCIVVQNVCVSQTPVVCVGCGKQKPTCLLHLSHTVSRKKGSEVVVAVLFLAN